MKEDFRPKVESASSAERSAQDLLVRLRAGERIPNELRAQLVEALAASPAPEPVLNRNEASTLSAESFESKRELVSAAWNNALERAGGDESRFYVQLEAALRAVGGMIREDKNQNDWPLFVIFIGKEPLAVPVPDAPGGDKLRQWFPNFDRRNHKAWKFKVKHPAYIKQGIGPMHTLEDVFLSNVEPGEVIPV